jgi:phage internal scaffolding protein
MVNKAITVRSQLSYDPDLLSLSTGLECPEHTLTLQSAKDDCDLNLIVDRMTKTGEQLPMASIQDYGDFTGAEDYHTLMNKLIDAQDAFSSLDAPIRERFNNDPGRLFDFLNVESNRDEAIKLGLINQPETSSAAPITSASE